MIQIKNLVKKYNYVTVLNIKELNISKGESFGLVGNNGAGKTTLFRLILDLIKSDNGEVLSKNVNVRESEEWKKYTTAFLDDSFLMDFLTPEEFFSFLSKIRNWSEDKLNRFYNYFAPFFNDEILGKEKYIRDLSKGNKQKVGIASTFIGDPEIIILDEPFLSLDPSSQIRLKTIINDYLKSENTTFLISSHDLSQITEVASRIAILQKGEVKRDKITNSETLAELHQYFAV